MPFELKLKTAPEHSRSGFHSKCSFWLDRQLGEAAPGHEELSSSPVEKGASKRQKLEMGHFPICHRLEGIEWEASDADLAVLQGYVDSGYAYPMTPEEQYTWFTGYRKM